jgi:hypothetical protein
MRTPAGFGLTTHTSAGGDNTTGTRRQGTPEMSIYKQS